MTKGELLQFLTPFTDEIELYIDTGEDELLPVGFARYSMCPDGTGIARLCVGRELNLAAEPGEKSEE